MRSRPALLPDTLGAVANAEEHAPVHRKPHRLRDHGSVDQSGRELVVGTQPEPADQSAATAGQRLDEEQP